MAENQKMSIKNWAEEDRPREKLMLKGVSALTDSELLAILIRTGTRQETAVELSKRILQKSDNDLNKLAKLSVKDLKRDFKGVGETKAISIVAALELGKRKKETERTEKLKISSSKDAYELFCPFLIDLNYEETWAAFLDSSNSVISTILVSRGGISGTVVDIRLILREALSFYTSGIILAHNHPSGNPKPSEDDIVLTRKLKEAAQWMDILLLDHIIVCGNNYFSFADEELVL